MKHPINPTILILIFFVLSQITGLGLLAADITTVVDEVTGQTTVEYSETIGGPRPQTTGAGSFAFLALGVGIGTALLLVLVKFRLHRFWKLWYFVAVWMAMAIAIGAITPVYVAVGAALLLAALKIFRSNMLIHNITEVLVYTGIAFLIVPIFDVFWVSVLLVVIAIYDAIAVWKSKHMISLAQFQTESKLFAGLQIPYSDQATTKTVTKKPTEKKKRVNTAILGGGDIAFPLLFSGAVLQWTVGLGYSSAQAFLLTLIITATTTISLAALFWAAKKDHFYPAMPPLAAGCFAGLAIVALIVL